MIVTLIFFHTIWWIVFLYYIFRRKIFGIIDWFFHRIKVDFAISPKMRQTRCPGQKKTVCVIAWGGEDKGGYGKRYTSL